MTEEQLNTIRAEVEGAAFRVLGLPTDAGEYFYPSRIRRFAEMRWAMAVVLQRRGLSHYEIGRCLNKNHCTITYSLKMFYQFGKGSTSYELYERLIKELDNEAHRE